MQILGDRAADQNAYAQLRKTKCFLNRQDFLENFLPFAYDMSSLGFDNVDPPNHIKDRRDPIVPCRKCRSHHSLSCLPMNREMHLSCQD